MNKNIKNFFYPSTICVAGASTKEKSIGYELLKTIKNYGYTGKIFPVNPKADEVFGYKCYHSIEEINDKIDLAIVVVPKQFAEESIDQLLAKNVKSIILVTAGFKETGKEGEEAEKRILQKVKDAGARLVGPNCMGVITTFENISLNATFVAEKPEVGNFGFCSQSGAIAAAVLNSLRETDIRFGQMISAGNKADINENDLLTYWQSDDRIKTLTYYLESFEDGEGFINHFIKKEITKPVIILKGGRTSAGMKAASSHTGALGSNDKVVDSILDQFGIIRADDLNELFNTAKGLENFPFPKGNKVVVITNAGGPAILAVDAIEKEGLNLAQLSDETKNKLREIVHPEGSVNNPVDLLPGGTAEQFKTVNEIVAEDKNVDAVVTVFVEPVMVPAFEVIEGLNSIDSGKPHFTVCMPLPEFWEKYRKESGYKKPLFRNPEDPSKVISNMLFFNNYNRNKNFLSPQKSSTDFKNEEGFISQKKVTELCEKYGLPVVKTLLLKPDMLEAKAKSEEEIIEFPVVLKGLSKEVVHKSELDAVKLNIKNKNELLKAAVEMKESFKQNDFEVEEFMIQPFLKPKHEVLIGGFKDNSFGPMIMFGTGGKYVEVYNDTAMKSAHLSDEDIYDMLYKTKMGKILEGVRGEKPIDIDQLKIIIRSAAQMMLDNPQIKEFDFNPLIITEENKLFAVDVRVKV